MKFNSTYITNKYFAQRKRILAEREVRLFFWKNLRELDYSELERKLTKHVFFSFKHSGHLGDIIYSLPIVKQLSSRFCSQPALMYLNLYYKSSLDPSIDHPSGRYALIPETYSIIKPLLESQEYISSVKQYSEESVDFDLDYFRDCIYTLDRGNISKWYQEIIPIDLHLEEPWLKVNKKSTEYSEYIVLSRSTRYHWNDLSYSFLRKYPNVAFVGLEYEFKLMKEIIPNIKYIPTNDFLELAQIIAGARLFIGNQSSPFAIAEALKVNRLLECYLYSPNVDPIGGHNAMFSSQACFEFLVKDFFENK